MSARLGGAASRRRISMPALGVACAALLLAAWPMAGRVPLFAFAVFLGALAARICIHHFRLKMPPLWLKLLILGAGIGSVYSDTRTLIGIEPGLGIFLILVSLKLLELRTGRDFQVLVLLGWFLGLCRLFFAQNLVSWAETIAVSLLMVTALLLFHGREMSLGRALRGTLLLALQSLPLVALLFLLFPRAYTGVRFSFNRGLMGGTGMTDSLEPGSFSGIAQNDDVAFHAAFPDGPPPPPEDRYWRGAVLWKGENLRWTRGLDGAWRSAPAPARGNTDTYRQDIMIQPHGEDWLFALDWPVGDLTFRDERETTYEFGETYRSRSPVLQALQYQVVSQISGDPMPLRSGQRDAALQLPRDIPPQAAALAREWRREIRGDRAFVDRALRYITDEEFSYTLAPGAYRRSGDLDEFLFDRRVGFCEHYAAAFATLMRLGGIPSRIVIGYRGGELNESSTPPRLIVRQSDAHAWCEVWLDGTGWTRKDPTASIAPDRISQSLQSLLQMRRTQNGGEFSADGAHRTGWSGLVRRARMAWDNLNYRWDVDVLNYGDTEQKSLLASIGLSQVRSLATLLLVILLVTVALGLLMVVVRKPWNRSFDPALRAWQRFCRRLAAAGLERAPSEGPLAYSERAASRFPEHAEAIRQIARQYLRLRYYRDPPPVRELQRLTRRLPVFRR